jgi:hypothetical protein
MSARTSNPRAGLKAAPGAASGFVRVSGGPSDPKTRHGGAVAPPGAAIPAAFRRALRDHAHTRLGVSYHSYVPPTSASLPSRSSAHPAAAPGATTWQSSWRKRSVEGAAPTSLSVSITVLASVCWAVTFISLGEREDDEVVGRDDALLGLERRELLVAGEQGLVLDDDEEHARCRRRHELGFKASFSSLICNFTHTALLFFFAIPVLPEIRGGNRQQLSYSAKIVRAGRPASSLEFSFIAEATMRGLVFVAGLSLFGGLPAGSAAADDNQNLKAWGASRLAETSGCGN